MKRSVAIVGGGASALFLAVSLDTSKYKVTIYERNKTLGRKFLVAGKGGFNLTHSEPVNMLTARYTPIDFLHSTITRFDNQHFRDWLASIGIQTFVGSSKRVYPIKGIKPIEVLKAVLNILEEKEVQIKTEHTWMGWDEDNTLIFNKNTSIKADFVIFALGGGSWKVTGSDGLWQSFFEEKNIKTVPFQASNCAFKIEWNEDFIVKHEGTPLKNIAIRCNDNIQKGEVVITKFGLEGNGIYGLSPQIRASFLKEGVATIYLDFKSVWTLSILQKKIENAPSRNMGQVLKKTIKLSPAAIHIIKSKLSKTDYLNPERLAFYIKNLPLTIIDTSPIDEAISTVGGIDRNEVDPNFQFKQLPDHFCIGEMLDWDTPTGGYLLQACYSMGLYLGEYLNQQTRLSH